MPVSRAARAAARCTRSSRALTHGLSVPISPMIPGRTPGARDAVAQLADQLGGQVVDAAPIDPRLGRVVGLAVPAAAHHDLHAGPAGEAPQALRVAADARQGELHQRRAAASTVVAQLVGDEVLVGGELPVVPSVLDVPEVDAGVLVGKREADALGWDRPADGHDSGSHRGASGLRLGAGRRAGAAGAWVGIDRPSVPPRAPIRNGCRRSPGDGMLTARAAPAAPDGGIQPLSQTAVTLTTRCRIGA